MSKFIEYVTNLVGSVGINVSDDNLLLTSSGTKITSDKIPLCLPTKEMVDNSTTIENGELKHIHKPFNPFSEDDLKRNPMLVQWMRYASLISTAGISTIIQQLILLLDDEEAQEKIHTSIQKWIIDYRKSIGSRGKLVNQKTAKEFTKFTTYLIENNLDIVRYRIANGGKVDGITYLRLAKVDASTLDVIEKDYEKMGISERSKNLFLSMINFIIPEINNTVAGSKSKLYPSFVSALKLYNEVQGRINYLLEQLKEVHSEPYEELYMPLLLDTEVEKFRKDIDYLPGNYELDSQPAKKSPLDAIADMSIPKLQNNAVNLQVVQPQQSQGINVVNQLQSVNQSNQEVDGLEMLRRSAQGSYQQHGFINNNNTLVDHNFNSGTSGNLTVGAALQQNMMNQQMMGFPQQQLNAFGVQQQQPQPSVFNNNTNLINNANNGLPW